MSSDRVSAEERERRTRQNINYIREMLGELRLVAERESAQMLCYLIEMAYVEAGDVQNGKRSISLTHGEANKSSRLPM